MGNFTPGDKVFACAGIRLGGYGEYVALPASYTIVSKPGNMSFADAAAVPLGGLNALHFMRLAKVQPGEHVAINGAGGSIGSYAVQIAKSMGAEVTAVDSGFKEAGVRGFGVDHFLDYTHDDFTAGGRTYDVIFDTWCPGAHMRPVSTRSGRRGAISPATLVCRPCTLCVDDPIH